MKNSALVVIDLQNDITKNYREIIEKVNAAIDWADKNGLHIVYIQHNKLSDGTRTFKPGTRGAELVPELKVVSDHIFTKSKSSALTDEEFVAFIKEYDITEFYIVGADAAACIKSTCFNMAKSGYTVHVLSDCITSYDTGMIVKTKDFDKPIAQLKKGGYKMKSGLVYLGFSTDFLIEEADAWRGECWKMIKERSDCTFLFLTKRIERFAQCIPEDWGDGYENVTVCCTIENQRNADKKLSVFSSLPIKHRCITAQPLIERVNLEPYLDGVELVVVGGESDKEARPLDYDWVLDIREQCIRKQVNFEFRQCGTHFIKDGREYKLQTKDLCKQARLADINYKCKPQGSI